MSWSVRWIVLPNGVIGDELKLSIVATPAGSLGDDWTTVLAGLAPRRLVSADGSVDLPLTVTSIAGATTPTHPLAADIAAAAIELEELERSMARVSPTDWPSGEDTSGLDVLGEMVATRRRGRVPAGAVTRLAQRAGAVHDSDLAATLGLRIDATVRRFEGEHAIRVAACDGRPLDGPVPVAQPWTLVRSDSSAWIVVPRDGGTHHRPAVTVSHVPVAEVSGMVDALAEEVAAAGPEHRVELPQLDDGLFTLAMRLEAPDRQSDGVLHAEDVTCGMRADVAINGGAFQPIGEGAVISWEADDSDLRYGDRVRFAVQAIDLAGNPMAGSEQIVSFGRYLRRSPVDPPAIVGTAVDEALDVVVRSDADGCPLGSHAEWTIVPPELDSRAAIRHGVEPSADPAAAGVALIGLPGRTQPVVIPFAGMGPKNSLRLSIRAAVGNEVSGDDLVVDHDVGSDLVELLVPPGVAASFELASPVAGDALQDLHVGDLPPSTLLDGSAVMRCRRRRVSVLHAVQRPAASEVAELLFHPRVGVPA